MKNAHVCLTMGLLVLFIATLTGCGGTPDLTGKYVDPEGGRLTLKADGTMSVMKLPGTETIKGTYRVKDDELILYGPGTSSGEPLMTLRINDVKHLELIDVTGLIWIKQPPEE